MKISQEGIDLIKHFEGCCLKAYKDAGGYSIGYGHYGAKAGDTITQAQAEEYLRQDIKWVEDAVNAQDKIYHFNQNQFDALCSFTYNCGAGSLKQLTANGTRTLSVISAKMMLYNKSQGRVLEGLTRRRKMEQELFNSTCVASEPITNQPEPTLTPEEIEALATAVIRGEYGNGAERKKKLGSKYAAVQKRVNERMKKGGK